MVSLILFVNLAFAQYSKPLVQAEVSRKADTAHVEFRGLKNWDYDLKREGGTKVILTIPPMDDASLARLQSFSDPFVENIEIKKNGPDGKNIVTFKLSRSDIESFDYQTDEPSRLIIDFYRKAEVRSEKTAAPAKPVKRQPAKAGKTAAGAKGDGYTLTPKPSRAPAGDEFLSVEPSSQKPRNVSLYFGIFDGSDENYDRFRIKDYEIREESIIGSRNNIYLPFPMLKMNVSRLDHLMELQPEYVIKPTGTKENKEARLLLTLYNRGRFGVFAKTYDYFMHKYPDSKYADILKNIAAHVYLQRWRSSQKSSDFEIARKLYSELVQKYPDSPIREQNYLTLGFAQMERGEALATLQTLQGFMKAYPQSPEIPNVRKALSESYMTLRKYDEAAAELQTIIKDFPRTDHAKEARYRLGDVEFARGDYAKAIQTYEQAIKDLPAYEKIYPNAHFNMAEARFWQKDFKAALNDYVDFINLFPTHSHGGYALTRVGELLGILGADQRRVMGAFLESYFRFPDHPGAKVARIRMLSQQMKSMKTNELKKALEEINQTAKNLNLKGIEEFTTLMTAEGLTHRGQYKDALAGLITHYQKNPSSVNLEQFKSRILRNIANQLKTEVESGEFMRALTFHSQYSSTWLKNSDRIDVPYFVAGAYEKAGAFDEAEKIYRGALNQRIRIKGTDTEKEKKVQEHLPSISSINLRLAAVLAEERKYMDAFQHLKEVGDGKELSPEENIERVRLSALIAEQKNEPARAREALLELAKRWQGDPALLAPVHLQLAQTYMRSNDPKKAEEFAEKVLKAEGGETPVADKVVAAALQVKGDALLAQKKSMAAVEAYQTLLERFEQKMPIASVRYKVGQILFDRGDLKGAGDVWRRLEGGPNEFLWKVGREKLEQSDWEGDYKKYINRIPAMANSKPKESK